MGIIWRFAMPLLNTLAALVIIVHSAEEELEYRQHLRPRVVDTGTPVYDQPWRVVESEPVLKKSTQSESWNDNTQEEIPRRRRPGRKRRRRPQETFSDDLIPQERYAYPEDSLRPYYDVEQPNVYTTTEIPKRRRKKLDSLPPRWLEENNEERQFKRRGLRRRKPVSDGWSKLSEFNSFKAEDSPPAVVTEDNEPFNLDDEIFDNEQKTRFVQRDNSKNNEDEPLQIPKHVQDSYNFKNIDEGQVDMHGSDHFKKSEDKSLSEFSIEAIENPTASPPPDKKYLSVNVRRKIIEKSYGDFKEFDKAQNPGPIDPITLKSILKRSNGTSLSEILQQHNLTLLDLLQGKENALRVLKSESSDEIPPTSEEKHGKIAEGKAKVDVNVNANINEHNLTTDATPQTTTMATELILNELQVTTEMSTTTQKNEISSPKINLRRFVPGARRKLRMRPSLNSTTNRSQTSKDLIALNVRKYAHHRRNFTKMNEWKDVFPLKTNITEERQKVEVTLPTTTAFTTEETFTQTESKLNQEQEDTTDSSQKSFTENEINYIEATTSIPTTPGLQLSENAPTVTFAPLVTPIFKHPISSSGLRRQAYNNRLKKQRIRQKNSTTESPQNDDNNGKTNSFVAFPDFVGRTEEPLLKTDIDMDFETTLEDFFTTQSPKISGNKRVSARIGMTETPVTETFTEETAKIEMEEIFNDTQTSSRLAKILKDRNMTFNELVEHRERGSSHVHLADIFHNASKEPNPPEPFLAKSLIEPISKETYPLRAILEANSHEVTAKTTTIDPITISNNVNIPVILDFRNNVNENAENMGIMSLFQNVTKGNFVKGDLYPNHNSDGLTYPSTVPSVTKTTESSEILRKGRILNHNVKDDIVSWNDIFDMMKKNYSNETKELLEITEGTSSEKSFNQIEEDVDGDGLIVLEDLQRLRELGNKISPFAKELDLNSFETQTPTAVLERVPSQAKSVTVATASIAGLAIVLFLLTYAAFKWKQQKCNSRKRSFSDSRIPTPVFESIKGHKNNTSTRSISPMLSSNIYTLNTLDSRHGQESPEYMWDTLRKPFQ